MKKKPVDSENSADNGLDVHKTTSLVAERFESAWTVDGQEKQDILISVIWSADEMLCYILTWP